MDVRNVSASAPDNKVPSDKNHSQFTLIKKYPPVHVQQKDILSFTFLEVLFLSLSLTWGPLQRNMYRGFKFLNFILHLDAHQTMLIFFQQFPLNNLVQKELSNLLLLQSF